MDTGFLLHFNSSKAIFSFFLSDDERERKKQHNGGQLKLEEVLRHAMQILQQATGSIAPFSTAVIYFVEPVENLRRGMMSSAPAGSNEAAAKNYCYSIGQIHPTHYFLFLYIKRKKIIKKEKFWSRKRERERKKIKELFITSCAGEAIAMYGQGVVSQLTA